MHITIDKNIVLIGTAHISQESVDEVKQIIETEKPDIVAVELDDRRYKSLIEKTKWENTPINKILKSNNAYLMLAQIFLGSIQRRLGKDSQKDASLGSFLYCNSCVLPTYRSEDR